MENRSRALAATFHLTHNCNLRCSYCYTGEKFGIGMTPQTAERAVDFCLSQARENDIDHLDIVFFGGEPLLRKRLLYQIIDRFHECQGDLAISFKMSTNGLLLDDETVDELSQRRVYISLSIDGDPQIQDRQRPDIRGRGTAQRLQPIIDKLLQWNPHTNANCVITPESAAHIDRGIAWLYERGFSYISTTLDYSGNWQMTDLQELQRTYQRLGEWYIEQTLTGRKFYLSCFDEKIRSRTRGPLDCSERCALGYRQFSIAPSGRLYPCVQFVREDDDSQFIIGDIDNGFDTARRQAIFQCSEKNKPECSGCVLQSRCSSWCACVNWQSTGHIDQASPVVCAHEQILMPIADRVANRLWKQRDATFIHKHYNPAFPVISFIEDIVIKEISDEVEAPS